MLPGSPRGGEESGLVLTPYLAQQTLRTECVLTRYPFRDVSKALRYFCPLSLIWASRVIGLKHVSLYLFKSAARRRTYLG